MFCFLNLIFARCKFRKNINKPSSYVTRDDLDAKNIKGVTKGAAKPLYNRDTKHASFYENENRGTMRIKVVMTKEEAMMLFSKCDRGGTLSFKNVSRELTKIPANSVSLDHPWSTKQDVMLESIPEEP
ncbi:hypothetical protein L1987_26049 [Smallanthus sonchifolius]|uniref:Uncharacterized protein n=1 Tax=Smallanthus sonchifolius TaxID=185202 RepID=A0ACB9IAE4_9ASTR|nr:hypothetical protein L1987_26049 [Smallanthus sonchifolius]